MKKIKIIMTVLALSVMYQYAEAQSCTGNKVRMFSGLRGCGCNTCQRICVDAVDVATYQANGWSLTGCSKFCCAGFFRTGETIPVIETSLADIHPNPTSGMVTIDFTLAQQSVVTLQVFDIMGKHITTIEQDVFEDGGNEVNWDASTVNPGIYFLQMRTDNFTATKRISVIN